MVILVMQIVHDELSFLFLSGLLGHPKKVNNPWNITLIWYGLKLENNRNLSKHFNVQILEQPEITAWMCYTVTFWNKQQVQGDFEGTQEKCHVNTDPFLHCIYTI